MGLARVLACEIGLMKVYGRKMSASGLALGFRGELSEFQSLCGLLLLAGSHEPLRCSFVL